MFDRHLSPWKHHLADSLASPALAQSFEAAVTTFLAFLAEQGVTEPTGITPAVMTTWRKALRALDAVPGPGGLLPSEQFFAVRFFLRYLERYGDLQTDPARDLAPLPVKTRETARELSAREVQALLLAPDLATDSLSVLTYAVGWRDRAALDLLYHAGLTPRRLLRLPVSAVPLGILYVPEREGEPFDPHGCVAAWLRARPRFATDQSPDTLFLNPDGTALTAAGLSALVTNAARYAGIPKHISPTTVTLSGVERRRTLLRRGLDVCCHAERNRCTLVYARRAASPNDSGRALPPPGGLWYDTSMTATEYKYITVDDAGVARIGKTRYKVRHLAGEVRYHGWSPYELLLQHPDLTLGQIYSALAYYADHQAEMDAAMDKTAEMVRQARKSQPSDLREKLVDRLKKA